MVATGTQLARMLLVATAFAADVTKPEEFASLLQSTQFSRPKGKRLQPKANDLPSFLQSQHLSKQELLGEVVRRMSEEPDELACAHVPAGLPAPLPGRFSSHDGALQDVAVTTGVESQTSGVFCAAHSALSLLQRSLQDGATLTDSNHTVELSVSKKSKCDRDTDCNGHGTTVDINKEDGCACSCTDGWKSPNDVEASDVKCTVAPGPCDEANVYEKVSGVGGYGGSCTCPNGQTYEVGDNDDQCGSMACIGGVPGDCEKKRRGHRVGMRVTCGGQANRYEQVSGVGGFGGSCTCPNGQTYEVGDRSDDCGSMACIGGVAGPCEKVRRRGRVGWQVTCDAQERCDMAQTPAQTPCDAGQLCSGHGTTDDDNSADGCECLCTEGFSGTDCSQPPTPCTAAEHCSGHGSIEDSQDHLKNANSLDGCECQCESGWLGADCSTPVTTPTPATTPTPTTAPRVQCDAAQHCSGHGVVVEPRPFCTAVAPGDACPLAADGSWTDEDVVEYVECLQGCCQDYDSNLIIKGVTCADIASQVDCEDELGGLQHIPAGTRLEDMCSVTCGKCDAPNIPPKDPTAVSCECSCELGWSGEDCSGTE